MTNRPRWTPGTRLLLALVCLLTSYVTGQLVDYLISNVPLRLLLTVVCAWLLCWGLLWLTSRPFRR